MLERFTDYLRASLSGLREETTTLGDELHMAENYLGPMQARMEDRLRYRLYVPDALRSFALPPLLLQPLLRTPSTMDWSPRWTVARSSSRRARMGLCNPGGSRRWSGPQAPRRRPGTGMALDNLRARLEARYGAQASMELADAQPGTRVTLRLPLHQNANHQDLSMTTILIADDEPPWCAPCKTIWRTGPTCRWWLRRATAWRPRKPRNGSPMWRFWIFRCPV